MKVISELSGFNYKIRKILMIEILEEKSAGLMNTNTMFRAGHLYLSRQRYYSITEGSWRG